MTRKTTPNTESKYHPVVWSRWPAAEEWFRRFAPASHYAYVPELAVGDIDVKASTQNSARLGDAIDADRVRNMVSQAESMTLHFPALVARRTPGRPPVVLLDGNNRLATTVKVGGETVAAYVFDDLGDGFAAQIGLSMNGLVGKTSTSDERVELAIRMLELNPELTVRAAAERIGIGYSRLNQRVNAKRLRDKMLPGGELYVDGADVLFKSTAVMVALTRLDNPNVFRVFVGGLIQMPGVGGERVEQMVTAVANAKPKTEANQKAVALAELARLEADYTTPGSRLAGGHGRRLSPGEKFTNETSRYLTKLTSLFGDGGDLVVDFRDVLPDQAIRDQVLADVRRIRLLADRIVRATGVAAK